jgi:LuxR family quorum sensing-dependent transcriptional regulator
MSRKELDETLDFIRNVERAKSPSEVCQAILKAVQRYGFQNILAGTIPLPGSTKPQQESHVVLHDWPAGWWDRYFSQGYLFADPAIRRVTMSPAPFLWDELDPLCRDNPKAARVMDEAADFRLKSGFTVPLVTLEGEVAGFTIAGERVEMPPHARGMLALLATYALGHSLNLMIKSAQAKQVRITNREREVLQWVATGKTEWEVGEILDISEHTVDKFLRSARMKLGARTSTQAIAEAFRLHIIS